MWWAAWALASVAGAQDGALDWGALPPLPYRTPPEVTAPMHEFVAREARLQRCAPRRAAAEENTSRPMIQVDLAVLVTAEGTVRVVVPRAMNCPTVEQYAAGLVSSFARNNLLPRGATADQWYRTSVTFAVRP